MDPLKSRIRSKKAEQTAFFESTVKNKIKYVDYSLYSYIYDVFVFLTEQYDPSHYEKTHPHTSILQVPTTQLAKMSIDPKFVELTADVLEIIFIK